MSRKNTTYSSRGGYTARSVHERGRREFTTYDTSAIVPQKSRVPLIALIAGIVVVIALIVVMAVRCTSDHGTLAEAGTQVEVSFPEGINTDDFANRLFDAHLIESRALFIDAVKTKNAAEKLKPGTYIFIAGMTPAEIVDELVAGPGKSGKTLMVPEGNTIKKTARLVEKAYDGTIKASEFIAEAHKASSFAEEFPFVEGAYDDSLEGFLFPKTYQVHKGHTARQVIEEMLRQYQLETENLDYAYPTEEGLSHYDVLILASVVEREAASVNRPEVASVFYNRLNNGMALQSDATTAYVVGGDPTPDDLKVDGPYNTYLNKGLPKGPICSPGLDSLKAVCNPADTNYFFFVFYPNADGGMDYYFNETYEGHQQDIKDHAPKSQ